jgi:hypothetical protein
MVANWSTGAAHDDVLFLLIPRLQATPEASRIKALPLARRPR